MKYSKILAAALAAALMCAALTACGGGSGGSDQTSAAAPTPDGGSAAETQSGSASNLLTDKYPNYAKSYTDEFGAFVNGDMDKIFNGVADLNADNFTEWKALYDQYYDRCEHWYNELGGAEMLVPEDKAQAHKDLTVAVGTIYKILEGMEPRVTAAEGGDFSQLTSLASEYAEADQIAHDMWDRASAEVLK